VHTTKEAKNQSLHKILSNSRKIRQAGSSGENRRKFRPAAEVPAFGAGTSGCSKNSTVSHQICGNGSSNSITTTSYA
jgi:hypothetical protein